MTTELNRFTRIKSLLQDTKLIDSHTISAVVAECDAVIFAQRPAAQTEREAVAWPCSGCANHPSNAGDTGKFDRFIASLPAPQQATPAIVVTGSPAVAQALGDLIEEAQQATPEPVGEPYGWAVTGCHSLYRGEWAEATARGEAKRCGGTARAVALYARRGAGVPEGFDVQALTATGGGHKYPLIVVRDKSSQLGEDVFQDEHPVIYGLLSAWLAAAQAKGGEHG